MHCHFAPGSHALSSAAVVPHTHTHTHTRPLLCCSRASSPERIGRLSNPRPPSASSLIAKARRSDDTRSPAANCSAHHATPCGRSPSTYKPGDACPRRPFMHREGGKCLPLRLSVARVRRRQPLNCPGFVRSGWGESSPASSDVYRGSDTGSQSRSPGGLRHVLNASSVREHSLATRCRPWIPAVIHNR